MRSRGRPDAVALSDERTAVRSLVRAARMAELRGPVEHRQASTRFDGRVTRGPQHDREAGHEQQERREQRTDGQTRPDEPGHDEEAAGTLARLVGLFDEHGRLDELSGCATDRVEQLPRRGVLQDDARRAAPQRGIADPRIEGEEHDARPGKLGLQRARDLDAGHLRHRVVEDDQVRVELERLRERLHAVGSLADDLEVGLGLEHRADALPYGEVVVGDQDARCHSA